MSFYVLSEYARRDLRDIADYTYERWGIDQAIRYAAQLAEAFHRLAELPGMGKRTLGLAVGLKSFPVQRHMVFYTEGVQGIVIVRVLHQSSLPHHGLFDEVQ